MSERERFRAGKDVWLRESSDSPLTPEQRATFGGLAYFADDPAFVVRGRLEPPDDPEAFAVPTSTGAEQVYRRAGVVRFAVDGQPAAITLLAAVGGHAHGFFVPFRDATNRTETYPAGRYLEVEPPDADGVVVIDFNDAYNPWCAYDDAWSCPLPPPENWLEVPIRAGEQRFPGRA